MKPYTRAERISGKIQYAITELLSTKIQDPRVEMATITNVKMTSDLRTAYLYITAFGEKKKKVKALEGFKASKGFIKKRIAPKLGLKYMPDIKFIYDDSFDKAAKMDQLIKFAINDISDK